MELILPFFCFVSVLMLGFAALLGRANWRGQQGGGLDGVGYTILADPAAAPAILGAGVGGLIWWRNHGNRRRARKAGQQ